MFFILICTERGVLPSWSPFLSFLFTFYSYIRVQLQHERVGRTDESKCRIVRCGCARIRGVWEAFPWWPAVHNHTSKLWILRSQRDHRSAQGVCSPTVRVDGGLAEHEAETEERAVQVAVRTCKIQPVFIRRPVSDGSDGAALSTRRPVATAGTVRVPFDHCEIKRSVTHERGEQRVSCVGTPSCDYCRGVTSSR